MFKSQCGSANACQVNDMHGLDHYPEEKYVLSMHFTGCL